MEPRPRSLFYRLSSGVGGSGLTCTNPKTGAKTKVETQPLIMNVDTLLIEASEPGDKVMDLVQGDNGRSNCLE